MKAKTVLTNWIYDVWFPKNVGSIYIVVKKANLPPQDAYAFSKEYMYLDNMGDKDLILYTYAFLSKYYPNAQIEICISDDFIKRADYEKNNLVILGGPSSRHIVCQQFMSLPMISRYVKYPPNEIRKQECCSDCQNLDKHCNRESLCVNKELRHYQSGSIIVEKLDAERAQIPKDRIKDINDSQVLIQDCVKQESSLFIALNNPFSTEKRVVIINGIHCMGGVGAFRAFEGTSDTSMENIRKFRKIHPNSKQFITIFDVNINPASGTPISCPILNGDMIINLEENSPVDVSDSIQIVTPTPLPFDFKRDIQDCMNMMSNMKTFEKDQDLPSFSEQAKLFVKATSDWVNTINSYNGKVINNNDAQDLHAQYEALRTEYNKLIKASGI